MKKELRNTVDEKGWLRFLLYSSLFFFNFDRPKMACCGSTSLKGHNSMQSSTTKIQVIRAILVPVKTQDCLHYALFGSCRLRNVIAWIDRILAHIVRIIEHFLIILSQKVPWGYIRKRDSGVRCVAKTGNLMEKGFPFINYNEEAGST
jgi:hypothetical protein